MSNRLKLRIASRLDNIEPTTRAVISYCRTQATAASDLDERMASIDLAMSEALSNVILHSYRAQGGHEIEIFAQAAAGRVYIEITDNGHSLHPGTARIDFAEFDPADKENLPEGGWGWPIILHEMDAVTYSRRNGRNQLRLTKSLCPVMSEKLIAIGGKSRQ